MNLIELPHALRQQAALAAMQQLQADSYQYYMVVRATDRVLRFHGLNGHLPEAVALWQQAEGLVFSLSDGDVDHVGEMDTLGELPDDTYRIPTWKAFFAPFGFQRALAINVVAQADMRGFLTLLRKDPAAWPGNPQDRRAVAKTIQSAFRAAWQAELDIAIPSGLCIRHVDGKLTGNSQILDWIAHAGAQDYLQHISQKNLTFSQVPLYGQTDRFWAPAGFIRTSPHPEGGTLFTFESASAGVFPDVLLLTRAQRRVAALAAAGATNTEIAQTLDISQQTVRTHMSAIYERLGIGSRAELATHVRQAFL